MKKRISSIEELIINWLKGANAGKYRRIYIAFNNRGGTTLNIRGYRTKTPVMEPGKPLPRVPDTKLALLRSGAVKILTLDDSLGIADMARKLGVKVLETEVSDFKANGLIQGRRI